MICFFDIGKEKIVFVFVNNLWVVDKDGGVVIFFVDFIGFELFF